MVQPYRRKLAALKGPEARASGQKPPPAPRHMPNSSMDHSSWRNHRVDEASCLPLTTHTF